MMLAAALMTLLQMTPLPAASASPLPIDTPATAPVASPDVTARPGALPPDCVHYQEERCPTTGRRPSVDACVRAAQEQERCAQQTTGFMHYVVLARAGSLWGMSAAWLGHRTTRGRIYTENTRRIFVELAHDPAGPVSIGDLARRTLTTIYGTDRPTPSTPFLSDRRRKP